MDTERDDLRVARFMGDEGEDFELWSLRINAILEGKELAGVVAGEEKVTDSEEPEALAAHTKKVRKARAIIINSLGDKPLRAVQSATDPRDMMTKLVERYAASTTANKIAVLTNLIHTRYESGKDMGEYLSEMESLFNKLAAMGLPLASEMQVAVLLVSLTSEESLSGTVSAIKTMDEGRASWEYVSGRLIEEVRSQKLSVDGQTSSVTAAAVRRADRSQIRCYKCNKKGHIARFCRTKIKEDVKKEQGGTDSDEEEDEEKVRVRAAVIMKHEGDNTFIVDSGCTQHITNDITNFTEVRCITPIRVHLADNRVVEAMRQGTLTIDLDPAENCSKGATRLVLSRVLYVPEAGVNMISCTQLDNSGISTLIEGGKCVLIDRRDKRSQLGFAKRRSTDDLFVLEGIVVKGEKVACMYKAEVADPPTGIDLWHRRLGHVAKDRVKKMAAGFVDGIDVTEKAQTIDCMPCVEAKQTMSPATGTLAKGNAGHIVHSDVIGPINPRTVGGARYVICFIVELSRMSKVYVVKKRNEVYDCFKEFQAWLERTTDVLVKTVHSDNAKEYVSLGNYLSEEGIVQSFATAYTPQSNGLAERYNRTLLDKVRALLQSAGMPMMFWGEAVLHAAYLTNVTGGKANDGRTPYEMVHGEKPDVTKLRIFGCAAYVHEPKERRHWKLEQRGMAGILLGHEGGMYRVWDIKRRAITVSKHVVFDETLYPATTQDCKAKTDSEGTCDDFVIDLNDTVPILPVGQPVDGNMSNDAAPTTWLSSEEADKQGDSAIDAVEHRYPRRDRKAPERLVANTVRRGNYEDMPTLRMAMESDESKKWKIAVKEELRSLEESNTWDIVDRPKKGNVIRCMWVLKKKRNADGEVSRYKARLVICGNQDKETLTHTFAPVVDFTVVRLILAVSAQRRWLIHQVDYSNAFLQGKLDRDVFMYVPDLMEGVPHDKVCLLLKSLYGLREAPRIWYDLLSKDLRAIGLQAMPSAPCVFSGEGVMVLCYVDDLLIMAENETKMADLKRKLGTRLPANDMGIALDFLGMKLIHAEGSVTLVQSKYAAALVQDLGLSQCSGSAIPCDPTGDLSTPSEEAADEGFGYRSIIGSLLYIATHTRPDIAVATSMLARHVEYPSKKHQEAVMKVVKYLKQTCRYGLKLAAGDGDQLSAHVDANWAGEPGAGRRSRTGIVVFYGSSAIHLTTALQKGITLSSTEAEYVALSEATKVIMWLRRVLQELGIRQESTRVYEDNAGALTWGTGHVAEDFRRSKHVDLRYHHVREQVADKAIELVKVGTGEMVADFLTKPLSKNGVEKAMARVNIVCHAGEEA